MALPLFRSLALLSLLPLASLACAQLAALYPGDAGIESDPHVLYSEQFEDDLLSIVANYDDVVNAAGMSLDTDVPFGSAGLHSLRITNIGGQNSGGHLYKSFSPGWDSTIYIRYYVKYPATSQGYIHHESIWAGGYNPMLPWPYPRAGDCGLGDSRLSIAYEPVADHMNTYMYWGEMHSDPNNDCWGNVMIKGDSSARSVPFDEWLCVELMIKLNDPDTAHNGELRIWHNGEEVGYWGQGFPTGHWLWDKFYITAGEPAFPGFRWRTDAALNLNYLWIEYYDDNSPPGVSHHILYDHLVVATEPIGPLQPVTGVAPVARPQDLLLSLDPATQELSITSRTKAEHAQLWILDAVGRVVAERSMIDGRAVLNTGPFAAGTYVCEMHCDGGTRSAMFVKN